MPTRFAVDQIDAVLGDLSVVAMKTGMLATVEIVEAVVELAAAGRLRNLLVDPVTVSSNDDRILDEHAELAYLERLLPTPGWRHRTCGKPRCSSDGS